ncbi:MAG: hypothetical protein NTZ84_02760 [Candidatus Nealsonbacteria bacterium]|nr:hypothetical protein [Candidatus Nealsonbacteria bacterium]
MSEDKEENDYRRHKIIREAVSSADRIIMDDSDGSEKETNYLTASVSLELMRMAFLPFGLRTVFFKPGNIAKRDVVQRAVNKALQIVKNGSVSGEVEADYLIAQVAKEFAVKALNPFGAKMLEKDLKNHYQEGDGHGK